MFLSKHRHFTARYLVLGSSTDSLCDYTYAEMDRNRAMVAMSTNNAVSVIFTWRVCRSVR